MVAEVAYAPMRAEASIRTFPRAASVATEKVYAARTRIEKTTSVPKPGKESHMAIEP
jgi:hypothetical protein